MLLCGELTCIRWGARVRINVQTDCHTGASEYRLKRWDDGVGLPWHPKSLVGWQIKDDGIGAPFPLPAAPF